MFVAAQVLARAVAVAFCVLGVLTVRDWLRHRDAKRSALALAVGLLGTASAIGQVNQLTAYRYRVLSDVSVLAFLGSGYGLLLFRHRFLPLSRRFRGTIVLALAAGGAIGLAARLPSGPDARFTPLQFAGLLLLFGAWSVCVAEPIVRFWRASFDCAAVQRARLRALSAGYACMIVILAVGIGSVPLGRNPALALVLHAGALGIVPLLYASFAPPGWLRRHWRRREEQGLRRAAEELDVHSSSRAAMAGRALELGVRLVGAEGGLVIDHEGRLLASRGLHPTEAGALIPAIELCERACILRIAGRSGEHAIVAPLPGGAGAIAVLSGPFTPLFGSEEVARLEEFAIAVRSALERVRLVEALEAQTERYEKLLQAQSDLGEGFAIVDAVSQRFLYVNDALCRIYGYDEHELLAMSSFMNLVDPEQLPALRERLANRIQGIAEPDHYEMAVRNKQGQRVDIEVALKRAELGMDVQLIAIVRNVSARKRVERELLASEERYRHAQERERRRAEQLGVLVTVSRRLAGLLNLDELLQVAAEGALQVMDCRYAEVVLSGEAGQGEDGERVARAGDEPRGGPRLEVAIGDHGRLIVAGKAGSGGFDDLDEVIASSLAAYAAETVEIARAFGREHEFVERLQSLDAMKDAFLTAVSHELRTPLTAVMGFAQTLERDGDRLPEERRQEMVTRLSLNAKKLHRMLGDLLDLDRLTRGIVEPRRRVTDVSSVVLRAIEQSDVTGRITVQFEAEPVPCAIDPSKVERIVENLLANAARYTPAGTQVWVRVRAEEGGVLICVDDAGPGVPESLRDSIFQPFQQGPGTRSHSPGVGIGLSLVARFAELHGGSAWVQERAGGGASFRVFLQDGEDESGEQPSSGQRFGGRRTPPRVVREPRRMPASD